MQSLMIQDIDRIEYSIPIIIRGKIIKDSTVVFKGRNGANFGTPNAVRYLKQIPLTNPSNMADLYDLSTDEIIEFLDDLGQRLILGENEHLQEAYKLACDASGLTPEVLQTTYKTLPLLFQSSFVEEMIENRIGKEFLDSWVQKRLLDGRTVAIRAFGTRTVHLIAGNVPTVSAASLIRSCITRSDSIFKLPS